MSDAPILTSVADRVLTIVLNRPEKHNAMTATMRSALLDALRDAGRDPGIGAIVVKGAGRSFCSGADVTPVPGQGAPDYEAPIRADIDSMRTWIDDWRMIWNLHQLVIAQVHGHCLGEAWDLALNCDMIVAAEDARFGYPVTRSLASPMSHMWTYLAGPQWAKYLLCSGDTIDGATAARVGLALRAVPGADLDDVTATMARRMASVPVDLLAANKSIVNKALELMGRSLLQQLAVESDAIAHKAEAVRQWYEVANAQGLRAALDLQERGMA